MGLLINVLIGAVVALIFYFVATALVTFSHSVLIFGLIALVLFVVIAFGTSRYYGRSRPPAAY
jgi:hypothetical protein